MERSWPAAEEPPAHNPLYFLFNWSRSAKESKTKPISSILSFLNWWIGGLLDSFALPYRGARPLGAPFDGGGNAHSFALLISSTHQMNSLPPSALIMKWNCSISLPFLFVFSSWRSHWPAGRPITHHSSKTKRQTNLTIHQWNSNKLKNFIF